MATRIAQKRLTKEYLALENAPPPYIEAHPDEANILLWHYVISGPPDTPYSGGQYLGSLMFPADYPFKPPAIRMITPSGRFQPSSRLCLSISDFHPDTWNPAWSVSTILTGLLSFMVSEEVATGTVAGTRESRARRARESYEWNLENEKFCQYFPHLAERTRRAKASGEDVAAAAARVPTNGELLEGVGRASAAPAAPDAAAATADGGAAGRAAPGGAAAAETADDELAAAPAPVADRPAGPAIKMVLGAAAFVLLLGIGVGVAFSE